MCRASLFLVPLALAACNPATVTSSNSATGATSSGAEVQNFALQDFEAVAVRGSDDVKIQIGSAFQVTAKGSREVLDQLDLRVLDGELRIGRKSGSSGGFFERDADILVVMPRLTRASVSGSSDLEIERIEGDVALSLAGSGELDVKEIKGGKTNLQVTGSGDVDLKGNADQLEVVVAGSGDVDADALQVASANITVTGSGSLSGRVTGDATISVSGSGSVELTGGAKCTVTTSGSGKATCR